MQKSLSCSMTDVWSSAQSSVSVNPDRIALRGCPRSSSIARGEAMMHSSSSDFLTAHAIWTAFWASRNLQPTSFTAMANPAFRRSGSEAVPFRLTRFVMSSASSHSRFSGSGADNHLKKPAILLPADRWRKSISYPYIHKPYAPASALFSAVQCMRRRVP